MQVITRRRLASLFIVAGLGDAPAGAYAQAPTVEGKTYAGHLPDAYKPDGYDMRFAFAKGQVQMFMKIGEEYKPYGNGPIAYSVNLGTVSFATNTGNLYTLTLAGDVLNGTRVGSYGHGRSYPVELRVSQ
jgi:hypothetical protein